MHGYAQYHLLVQNERDNKLKLVCCTTWYAARYAGWSDSHELQNTMERAAIIVSRASVSNALMPDVSNPFWASTNPNVRDAALGVPDDMLIRTEDAFLALFRLPEWWLWPWKTKIHTTATLHDRYIYICISHAYLEMLPTTCACSYWPIKKLTYGIIASVARHLTTPPTLKIEIAALPKKILLRWCWCMLPCTKQLPRQKNSKNYHHLRRNETRPCNLVRVPPARLIKCNFHCFNTTRT